MQINLVGELNSVDEINTETNKEQDVFDELYSDTDILTEDEALDLVLSGVIINDTIHKMEEHVEKMEEINEE